MERASLSRKAIIFGMGGHGRVVHSFIAGSYAQVLWVATDDPRADIREEVMFGQFDSYRDHDIYLALGNDPVRKRLFEALSALGARLPPAIAPSAHIPPGAEIGRGVFVGVGASLVANARIEDNAILNTHSSLDHDCLLGAHAQVTVGVSIAGSCTIGPMAFIGSGSTLLPGVTVGAYAKIRAGSLVHKDVAARTMVGGNPARLVRSLETAVE